MRFKVDENLPVEVAQLLRQVGHGAITVAEQGFAGRSDEHIASICQGEERALITLDTDFADIRTYPPEQYSGLVVLRLKQQDKPYVLRIIDLLMHALAAQPLDGRLWIVEERRIRIRGEATEQDSP